MGILSKSPGRKARQANNNDVAQQDDQEVTPIKSNAGGGGGSGTILNGKGNNQNHNPPMSSAASSPAIPPSPLQCDASVAESVAGNTTLLRGSLDGTSRVKSCMVWNVRIPPAVNSVQGHFLPKILHTNRERRLSVEVRSPIAAAASAQEASKPNDDGGGKTSTTPTMTIPGTSTAGDDFTVVRILVPATAKEIRALQEAAEAVGTAAHAAAMVAGKTATVAVQNVGHGVEQVVNQVRGGGAVQQNEQHDGDATANALLDQFGGYGGAVAESDDESVSTLGVRGVDDSSLVQVTASSTDHHGQNHQKQKRWRSHGHVSSTPRAAGGDHRKLNKQNGNGDAPGRSDSAPAAVTSGGNAHPPTSPAAGAAAATSATQPYWVEKYCFPLRSVTVNKKIRNVCVVTTGQDGHKKRTREIIFESDREASAFDRLIRNEKRAELDRSRRHMRAALGGKKIMPTESLKLLVEIVSAWDIAAGDFVSSDPYVVVMMGKREKHRTKYISKTLNPIWTLRTGSLFVLESTSRDLFKCYEGVRFEVWDYDAFSSDGSLGCAMVPPKMLYDGKGERMEFPLVPLPGTKPDADVRGVLVLRCRHASSEDLQFMLDYGRNVPPADPMHLMKHQVKTDLKGLFLRNHKTEHGVYKVRVRPGPDPEDKENTEWMTEKRLEESTFRKSTLWYEAGSGKLGRVYLEILGCDGLPNKDAGGLAGNKTDAFVAAVFEDCIVQTDVIDDALSPRWPPWSRRAFCFHVMHTSSQLFMGVFDYDLSDYSDHDPIGRVSVDLANLPSSTECILFYDLYSNSVTCDRKAKGTITIRLRVEWGEDGRQVLLSNLQMPASIHVNCRRRKDFELVRYTCEGKYKRYEYSLKQITSYVQELTSYQLVLFYIKEALTGLLLWRAGIELTLPVPCLPYRLRERIEGEGGGSTSGWVFTENKTFNFPLHSLLAFWFGTTLVERPTLLPSFWMACLAWIMLSTMLYRRRIPSPWKQCRSVRELLLTLVLGRPLENAREISSYENEAEYKNFVKHWEEKISKMEKLAALRAEKNLKAQREYQQEMAEIGAHQDMAADQGGGGLSIDPLKPILFPIQSQLAMICDALRVVRNVLIWEECFYSFWLTVASLVLSIVFYFIPWGFVVKWTMRLAAWLSLGPHMILVDKYYVSKLPEVDIDEEMKKIENANDAILHDARIRKEEAMKIRDMKIYKFGEHITKVPVLKLDRYRDTPLLKSYARPYVPHLSMAETAMEEAGKDRVRVPGQHLIGSMIPKAETPKETAPVGQPTAKPFFAEGGGTSSDSSANAMDNATGKGTSSRGKNGKGDTGRGGRGRKPNVAVVAAAATDGKGCVKTTAKEKAKAAIKVGMVVFFAVFFTFWGVPRMVYLVQFARDVLTELSSKLRWVLFAWSSSWSSSSVLPSSSSSSPLESESSALSTLMEAG